MPLPYYARLGRKDQAIYRQSVALATPRLTVDAALARATDDLEQALGGGRRHRVRKFAQALFDLLCDRLDVPPVKISIRERRPSDDTEELHGLYEREEGEQAVITAWMRTGTTTKIVKFRTFLRTLLHELVHHLDYEAYELEDSFHTEGFFKRESALMRSLRPPVPKRQPKSKPDPDPVGARPVDPARTSSQLSLF